MFRKFTKTESDAEVLSPEAHRVIQSELETLAHQSARDLTEAERSDSDWLDQSEDTGTF